MTLDNKMSFKEEVINQAIKSLEDAGFPGACSLSLMFDRVYQCGYNEASRMHRDEINHLKDQLEHTRYVIGTLMKKPKEVSPEYPGYNPPPVYNGCSRCGIGSDGRIMGYVCNRLDCPIKAIS